MGLSALAPTPRVPGVDSQSTRRRSGRPSCTVGQHREGTDDAHAGILCGGEVAEWLMAALLKSAESKDFVGSNPTLSATT